MNSSFRKVKKQFGYSLAELLVVVAILGGMMLLIFYFSGRVRQSNTANETAVSLATMVEKVRINYSGQLAAITPAGLNQGNLVFKPFVYDAGTTSITDAWGNSTTINASTSALAIVIGGAQVMSSDQCVSIAKTLVNMAVKINVGAGVSATAGVVSGGSAFFASGTENQANLVAGCASAAPMIGAQFGPT